MKTPIAPIAADSESPLWSWDWLKRAAGEVANTLLAIAQRHGWDPNALAGIIQLESGGDPQARNRLSGATGLIQWTEQTAKAYGTTTAAIYRMSQLDQLLLAERYWQNAYKTPPTEVGEYYMGVFSPSYIGKGEETVISKKGSNVYDQNAGLDWNGDGVLTTGDVKSFFRNLYRNHETSGALVTPPLSKPSRAKYVWYLGLGLAGSIGAYKLWTWLKESRGSDGNS